MKKSILPLLLCCTINLTAQIQFNNFENNNNLDVVIGPSSMDSIWQIGVPQKTLFDVSFSDPNAILTDSINNYGTNLSATFEIEINEETMWSFPFIQLEWMQKIDAETGVDGGIIEASYDQGVTWQNVLDDPIYRPAIVGQYQIDTLHNNRLGLTGTSTDWQWIGLCWGTPIGEHPFPLETIKLRFTFISDGNHTEQEGWMIDNFLTLGEVIGSTTNSGQIIPLDIYPNPATKEVILDTQNITGEDIKIQIIDASGRKVLDKSIENMNMEKQVLSLENYSKGIYFIQLIVEDQIYLQKFIKM